MAMLAGPRQRKRYNLVPKGKALFEDSDRYGTKMLEKMGWSKGKGLGSKENGQQEFVRIRYKNDANGLGYEDRDDQWTDHEKHFNGLLESLHAGDSNSNNASGDDGDEAAPRVGFGFEESKASKDKLKDKFSGQSLEEKSKNSKARVHYKKFTKGKDMTQYSEKDLANIFGKKATAEENDFYSQLPSFNAGNEASDDGDKQPFELGTQTVNTGLSVSDYFKMKMDALKNKKKEAMETNGDGQEAVAPQSEVIDVTNETDDEATEGSRKKKKKSKKQKLEEVSGKENEFEVNLEGTDLKEERTEQVCENGGEEPKPKKKKSKKANLGETESDCVEIITVEDEESEEQRPKKKRKKKSAEESAPDLVVEESSKESGKETDLTSQADEADAPSKKKKSKKNATEDKVESEDVPEQVPTESVADEPSQKRKKNKKRKAEEATESLASSVNDQADIPTKKKKTKRSLEDESDTTNPQPDPAEAREKKRKSKQQPLEETPTDSSVLTESNSTKSKKKNKIATTDNPVKVSSQHEISRLNDCYLDTYKISTFCAEKFRNVDLESFHCSNISQLIGYGFSENLELKIVRIDGDQDRITKLWSGTSNKYQLAVPKREIYRNYMTKAKQARREKKKIPKMKVKPLHRLNAFQSL